MWAEAAFLGLVQGLTEFLPVSSSAHLRIIGPLLPSGGDPGAAFTAITQIGTEAAVLLYFRHDIVRIFLAWWRSLPARGGATRCPHGLADPGRHPADRGAGAAVQGRDRDLAAQPVHHRGDADRLRADPGAADRFGARART
jgi:hypothetical protein